MAIRKRRMRIEALLEIVSPKKPEGVKRGIYKKPGVQGSVSNIRTRDFTTSKGNRVKVLFDVQGNPDPTVDINFYVNDTHYDDASTGGGEHKNDFEILSGVLYLTRSFVDKGKYNNLKFTAQKGSGDLKTMRNLDLSRYKSEYIEHLKRLMSDIKSYEPSAEEVELSRKRAENMRSKFGKEVSEEVIYKSELLSIMGTLLKNIESLTEEQFNQLHRQIIRWDRTIHVWKSYRAVIDSGLELSNAFESHSESGVIIQKNRRASLYMKLVKRYFPNWDVSYSYDQFELVRK